MFGKSKEEDLWSKVRELINIEEPKPPKMPDSDTEEENSNFSVRIREFKEFEEEIKNEINATFRRIFKALSDNEDSVKDLLKDYRKLLEEEMVKTLIAARRFRNQLELDVFDELRRRIIELNSRVEDIKELAEKIERDKRRGNRLFLISALLSGFALGVAAGLTTFYLCQRGFCPFK